MHCCRPPSSTAGQRSRAQTHVQCLHQSLILQTPDQRCRPEAPCRRPPSRPDGGMLGASIRMGFPGGASDKNPPASAGDVRDAGSIPGSGRSPGGGHGNPLQGSCLENPVDGGAWWATVHSVAKSRTPLSDLVQGENRDKGSALKPCCALNDAGVRCASPNCRIKLLYSLPPGCHVCESSLSSVPLCPRFCLVVSTNRGPGNAVVFTLKKAHV